MLAGLDDLVLFVNEVEGVREHDHWLLVRGTRGQAFVRGGRSSAGQHAW